MLRSNETDRFLSAAAWAAMNIRYCWLATTDGAGAMNVRPMGRLPRDIDEDEWIVRFVTHGRSRKVEEIRRAGRVAIIFQKDVEEAYLTLTGMATVRSGAIEDRRHWRDAYSVYFPREEDRKSAAFVEIRIDRMEMWIRGVTPEPFGLRPATLERNGADSWRTIA